MSADKRKVLITGGAGRLARYVAAELEPNWEVTLFDVLSPDETPFPWETRLKFVKGDLTNLADCMRAITLSQAETIIHIGAITHSTDMQPGSRMPQRRPEDTTMQVNVMGTYYIMDAARRLGVKKVVFGSSFYALGLGMRISKRPLPIEYLPIDEKHPTNTEDTYGLSKIIGEEIVHSYCRAYGMKGVALRFMGIHYPNIREIANDTEIEARPGFEGGFMGTTHQYADCRDLAIACRLAAEKDLDSEFEAFFVTTDNSFRGSAREVVEKAYPKYAAMAANIKEGEGIISDQKIKDMLGYKSEYTWRK